MAPPRPSPQPAARLPLIIMGNRQDELAVVEGAEGRQRLRDHVGLDRTGRLHAGLLGGPADPRRRRSAEGSVVPFLRIDQANLEANLANTEAGGVANVEYTLDGRSRRSIAGVANVGPPCRMKQCPTRRSTDRHCSGRRREELSAPSAQLMGSTFARRAGRMRRAGRPQRRRQVDAREHHQRRPQRRPARSVSAAPTTPAAIPLTSRAATASAASSRNCRSAPILRSPRTRGSPIASLNGFGWRRRAAGGDRQQARRDLPRPRHRRRRSRAGRCDRRAADGRDRHRLFRDRAQGRGL